MRKRGNDGKVEEPSEAREARLEAKVKATKQTLAEEWGVSIDEVDRVLYYQHVLMFRLSDLTQTMKLAAMELSAEGLRAICKGVLSLIDDEATKRSMAQLFKKVWAI